MKKASILLIALMVISVGILSGCIENDGSNGQNDGSNGQNDGSNGQNDGSNGQNDDDSQHMYLFGDWFCDRDKDMFIVFRDDGVFETNLFTDKTTLVGNYTFTEDTIHFIFYDNKVMIYQYTLVDDQTLQIRSDVSAPVVQFSRGDNV